MSYSPPPLPEYLARTHTLDVIVGVPTDEQVKAVHDTIRAVNSVANVPALYDSRLSSRLAQHLFTIQMAVYRSEYPLNVFSGENTYTPPSTPSHIPISLEPIIGAPSDEELESAHSAVRTLENLANSPFFDSALSTKLSQHVFNIQLARFIQDSNRGQYATKPANRPPQAQTTDAEPLAVTYSQLPEEVNRQDEDPAEPSSSVPTASPVVPPSHVTLEPASTTQANDKLHVAQQETNRLLSGNEELLKDIRRVLVTTYFSAHRRPYNTNNAYDTMNEKGELPWMHHLDNLYGQSNGSPSRPIVGQELVDYLKLYNLEAGLVEDGTGDLKPEKEADAQKRLGSYLFCGYPRAHVPKSGPT